MTVLTEIKANTEKLVLDVESLKRNYKELKDSYFPQRAKWTQIMA